MSDDLPRWLPLSELRRRRSYKWRAYPADVIPTFVAEMDVTLAAPVAGALQDAIAAGDTGYATADPELAQAAASFHHARFGWQVDPADIQLIPDVMVGVSELLRRAVPPGSGVVINTPAYPPFFSRIGRPGAGFSRLRWRAPAVDGYWTWTPSRRPSPRAPPCTSSAIPTTRRDW